MATRASHASPPPPATCILLALAAVGLVTAPAQAQRVGYRITSTGQVVNGVIDLGAGTSRPVSADEAQVDAVFTADGMLALTSVGGAVVVRHLPTGAQTTLAVDFRPVLAHPRRPVFFGFTGIGVLARLDARGLVSWAPCTGPGFLTFDLSLDGQQLFVGCPSGDVVVLDVETGAEIRRVTGVPTGIRFLSVNLAGDLVAFRSAGAIAEVVRLDAQTGAVLASRPALSTWSRTGSRRQLMESNCTGPTGACQYRLVDTATLAVSRDLPGATPFSARVFVSPDGREVVFNDAGYAYALSRAARIDIASGRVLNEIVLAQGDNITVNVVPVPLPPEALAATVSGSTVSLSWRLPADSPMATGYRLEAGTAPGGAAVTFPLDPVEAFSVAGVPPGRYYVRVRALNVTGVSALSAEIVVDVP